MPSCLGIYIEEHLIKYAKVSKEHENIKVKLAVITRRTMIVLSPFTINLNGTFEIFITAARHNTINANPAIPL